MNAPVSVYASLGDQPRRQQPADQFGSSAEVPLVHSFQPFFRQFDFDVFKHLQKHGGERDLGWGEIGRSHSVAPVFREAQARGLLAD